MDAARLVAMANQIAAFFRAQGESAVVDGVEQHLRNFWDPRMRREIVAAARVGRGDFAPGVREAVERLTRG
ncbi:MAG: formate dehydrogenase subunit delta [Caulobacteraceae bacterium]